MEQCRKIARIVLLSLILCLIVGATVYLNRCYEADEVALAAMQEENVSVSGYTIVFTPEGETENGFLFYPGGQVAPEAYAPLMQRLCEKGFLCIVVRMPCNLAVLGSRRAEGIEEQYPNIQHWIMGGHSLGGVMAASYLSRYPDAAEALVFLASYSSVDLSGSDLKVLSILGSEDCVLDANAVAENRTLLPASATEYVLKGGCHALFGNYGEQAGDGVPTISAARQQELTAEAIASLLA